MTFLLCCVIHFLCKYKNMDSWMFPRDHDRFQMFPRILNEFFTDPYVTRPNLLPPPLVFGNADAMSPAGSDSSSDDGNIVTEDELAEFGLGAFLEGGNSVQVSSFHSANVAVAD